MKKHALLVLMGLVSAHQSFACVADGEFSICTGDTIYKGSDFARGAIVRGVNKRGEAVTVQSINDGDMFEESARDLDVTDACTDYDDQARRDSIRR